MPIISSNYNPPNRFKNGHISTIYAALFRNVKGVAQQRDRITLPDGDFLDLDWSYANTVSDKLIIVLHGLEGNAQRQYMLGTAKIFNQNGIDAVCVNFRGCSGEPNLKYQSYHSGETEDLKAVIQHVIQTKTYKEIYLKGFSLGGNVVLKYLGETETVPNQIKAAVTISVPCYLHGSMLQLHKRKNVLYKNRFRRHLKAHLKLKQKQFPDRLSLKAIKNIKTLKDFDNLYTSKANGFKDALDYYEKSSSLQYLHNINIPTLVINAKNDSFLSQECYPVNQAEYNTNLHLELPDYGGHVGFYQKGAFYYNEIRALEFLSVINTL